MPAPRIDPLSGMELLRRLVAIPAPPGQEEALAEFVAGHLSDLGCAVQRDVYGNVLAGLDAQDGVPEKPTVVVMAHLDEIALLVTRIHPGGVLSVTNLGGARPWKWGEGPVQALGATEPVDGVLSFGSIHTRARESTIMRAADGPLTWDMARIVTGRSSENRAAAGVRPGTRVVIHPSRRSLFEFGDCVSGYFLDDRADLAAMLLAIRHLIGDRRREILFAATASEEVGGHGALGLLGRVRPDVAIALEIGPIVPDAPAALDSRPTVWVNDSYAAMRPSDIEITAAAADAAGIPVQWQALSQGGSDASCAASHGLVARPFTIAFAAENSHGFEVMHRDSVANLAALLVALLGRIAAE